MIYINHKLNEVSESPTRAVCATAMVGSDAGSEWTATG